MFGDRRTHSRGDVNVVLCAWWGHSSFFSNFNRIVQITEKKSWPVDQKTVIMDRIVYAHLKASAAGILTYTVTSKTYGLVGYALTVGTLLATDTALRQSVRTAGTLLRKLLVASQKRRFGSSPEEKDEADPSNATVEYGGFFFVAP